MFAFSILYLFLLFALLIVDRAPGLLPAGSWREWRSDADQADPDPPEQRRSASARATGRMFAACWRLRGAGLRHRRSCAWAEAERSHGTASQRTPAQSSWPSGVWWAGDRHGRARLSPRCRSIACSARSPAIGGTTAAAPQRRRRRCPARPSPSASTPMSRRTCPGRFQPVQREVTVEMGETVTRLLSRAEQSRTRPIAGNATFNVTPDEVGRLLRQDPVLLLHRADAGAGRERRDAGHLLRRSGDPRRTRTATDVQTITLSYTFFRAPDQDGAAQQVSDAADSADTRIEPRT